MTINQIGKRFEKTVICDGKKNIRFVILEKITKFDISIDKKMNLFNKLDKFNIIYEAKATNEKMYEAEEEWIEYDEHGLRVSEKHSYGNEIHWSRIYDSNGNNTYWKRDSDNHEVWNTYDDDGKLITQKESDYDEKVFKYDSSGKQKSVETKSEKVKLEYDDTNHLIEMVYDFGGKLKMEYDNKGNVIHLVDFSGIQEWIEYDENGYAIHSKTSDGRENWAEYEIAGNIVTRYSYVDYDTVIKELSEEYEMIENAERSLSGWRSYDVSPEFKLLNCIFYGSPSFPVCSSEGKKKIDAEELRHAIEGQNNKETRLFNVIL